MTPEQEASIRKGHQRCTDLCDTAIVLNELDRLRAERAWQPLDSPDLATCNDRYVLVFLKHAGLLKPIDVFPTWQVQQGPQQFIGWMTLPAPPQEPGAKA